MFIEKKRFHFFVRISSVTKLEIKDMPVVAGRLVICLVNLFNQITVDQPEICFEASGISASLNSAQ